VPEQIGRVAELLPPVVETESCGAVYDRFTADPSIATLAVVADGHPVGLINRYEFLFAWASEFARALYARKPITKLMQREFLCADEGLDVDLLQSQILADNVDALVRGFVVTREGRYLGVCTAHSLLRLTVLRSERRNREIEAARQEAVAASRSKSQFLANMSHELRTPLNAIIGFAEIIRGELYGPAGVARYVDYAADIYSSGQHLLSIINDILDMAKIEAGRMDLREGWLQPADAIGSTLRIVAEQARLGSIRMLVESDAALPRLLADERALRQMLLNLLSNAIKFTPAGGRVSVGVCLHRDGGIRFSVADTGIGMSPAEVERALHPFGQVDSELSRRHNGTGLGLTLVQSLIELHGGRLTIDSAKGSGTTVILDFPPARTRSEAFVLERASA